VLEKKYCNICLYADILFRQEKNIRALEITEKSVANIKI